MWLLILVITWGGSEAGIHSNAIEFTSRETCEIAKENIADRQGSMSPTYVKIAFCAKK